MDTIVAVEHVEDFKEFTENMKRLVKDLRSGVFPNRDLHHYYVPKEIRDVIERCLKPDVKTDIITFIKFKKA
jgi:hypothetical protein